MIRYFSLLIAVAMTILSACSAKLSSTGTALSDLKIMSYNIHHANPPSRPGMIDVDSIAGVIKLENPDLVALQEVDVNTGRSGKGINQAEAIAKKTGMYFYFAKAIDHDGGDYGIAVLSRFPLTETKKTALPTLEGTNGEPRVLAMATIKFGKKEIVFACTHLDAQRDDANRKAQMDKIVSELSAEKRPVILAGDLNAEAGGAVINRLDEFLERTCKEECAYTIPEVNPNRTIDFIATTPGKFRVLAHKVIAEPYASDHRPVVSILKMTR